MEDNDKIDPDYQKGFNEGYTIARHVPQLAEQLAQIDSQSARHSGFKAGREQYGLDRKQDRLPSWLKTDRSSKEPRSLSKDKDRDIEPDK